jgi:4-diphosphocytidyl-2-C-methyl-D-erythritol kinase
VTEPLGDEYDRPRPAKSGPVRVRVPAKINLYLQVGPLRPDGYHDLTTVYQAISIHDELTARPGDTLTLTMEGEGAGQLPLDETNLAIRAVRALSAFTGHPPHARLHLRKQIPIAGGLAGGSADAAAALVACDALWQTNLARDELADIASAIGSDVPFLVLGGTALGTGRGERVSPVLASAHTWHWVVAIADYGLSTPAVYAELDRLRDGAARTGAGWFADAGPPEALLAALRQRDPDVLAAALANDLQAAALSLRPVIGDTLDAGIEAGALAGFVSGSGPTCVFLASDVRHAAAISTALAESGTCHHVRTAAGPVAGARVS